MQNQQAKLGNFSHMGHNNINIIQNPNPKQPGRTPEPHARHPDMLQVKASHDLKKYEENLLHNKTNPDIIGNYATAGPKSHSKT